MYPQQPNNLPSRQNGQPQPAVAGYQPPQPYMGQPVQPQQTVAAPPARPMPPPAFGAVPNPYGQPAAMQAPAPKNGLNKKLLLIVGAVIVLLLVVMVVVAAMAGGGKKATTLAPSPAPTSSDQVPGLTPVKSTDLQKINNAISQDMSNLDDEHDFPESGLSDQTLGL